VGVAFWSEYAAEARDEHLYLQMAFDGADPRKAVGSAAAVETVGEVETEPDGAIDQLRIHRRIFRFQPRNDAWTSAVGDPSRGIPSGPPYFCAEHAPVLAMSLDGDAKTAAALSGLKVEAAKGGRFVAGVRGQAWRGGCPFPRR